MLHTLMLFCFACWAWRLTERARIMIYVHYVETKRAIPRVWRRTILAVVALLIAAALSQLKV